MKILANCTKLYILTNCTKLKVYNSKFRKIFIHWPKFKRIFYILASIYLFIYFWLNWLSVALNYSICHFSGTVNRNTPARFRVKLLAISDNFDQLWIIMITVILYYYLIIISLFLDSLGNVVVQTLVFPLFKHYM